MDAKEKTAMFRVLQHDTTDDARPYLLENISSIEDARAKGIPVALTLADAQMWAALWATGLADRPVCFPFLWASSDVPLKPDMVFEGVVVPDEASNGYRVVKATDLRMTQ